MPSSLRPHLHCHFSLSSSPFSSSIIFFAISALSPRQAMFAPPEFRAPPPSPVEGANGHGPEHAAGHDELAAFLSHSLRVPKLHLPHHIFPQEATAWDPPEIDYRKLNSPGDGRSCEEHLKSAAAAFGCFQLVNHGIPPGLVSAIRAAAAAAFRIPPDDKAKGARTSLRRWGFEIEEEWEGDELLWWCRSAATKDEDEMAGIWRRENYMSFRDKVEELWREIEKVASKIEKVLLDGDADINVQLLESKPGEAVDDSLICFHAPKRNHIAGIKHELLRMLVSRSPGCSCCLSLHLLGEASELHFHSKRGWNRFCPGTAAAIIVTVGDQMQACSGGLYKRVIAKPVLEKGVRQDCISMALHYARSQPNVDGSGCEPKSQQENTISLVEQIMVAVLLAIACYVITFF